MTTTLQTVNQSKLLYLISNRPKIPDGKSGDVFIKHNTIPAKQKTTIVSMRNAIFMGQKPTSIKFRYPLKVRSLHSKEHGKLMADHPQEIWQMQKPLEHAYGRVLIGGLGLGVISHLMSLKPDVNDVTTIEENRDIIKLVKPHIDADYVLQNDLFHFCGGIHKDEYNFAFFDIWQGTGESSWCKYVVPLRRLCRNKIKTIFCWNEEEMIGQCAQSLPHTLLFDVDSIPTNHNRVLKEACIKKKLATKKGKLTDIKNPELMKQSVEQIHSNKKLMGFLNHFLRDVGSDQWEKNFGDLWDSISK